ncbi:PepSY domain-containing protein [Stappia sp. GBMRC 2046]|uniref:PepSY domain-containing protein n=1 Tax=Stappia sediminis TaxID=2692190 RepID=A0A7X3LR99_9HYPH|nr:PepSY domain-containing protein [Stappia sediminis]MXN63621.1 PepSY domain-containing protein [Stappia sediminis]
MHKFLIASSLSVLLTAGAGAAFASGDDDLRINAPRDQWLSIPQVTEKYKAEGYDVRQVKVEDGAYEIYAIDKDGHRIEAYVHPVTGEMLKSDRDD